MIQNEGKVRQCILYSRELNTLKGTCKIFIDIPLLGCPTQASRTGSIQHLRLITRHSVDVSIIYYITVIFTAHRQNFPNKITL